MAIKMKLKHCMILLLGCFIISTIAWYITPFISIHNLIYLIGATSSWTGLIFSLFIIPQIRKELLILKYLRYFYIIASCFSMSLGAWLLILAIVPDNIPFLIGSISSVSGALTLVWIVKEFHFADKNNIALFKSKEENE